MIRAVLYRDAENHLTEYAAKGHAGYAEEGSDIVCAAVSVLGATCVNSLERVCGVVPEVVENTSGALRFRLPSPLPADKRHDAQVLMSALRQGLSDVAEQFPQYLQLSIRDWRKTS